MIRTGFEPEVATDEPLEKMVDSPDQFTIPTSSSKRSTAVHRLVNEIKMEARSNVFSPFSSPKPMANALDV